MWRKYESNKVGELGFLCLFPLIHFFSCMRNVIEKEGKITFYL